MLGRAVVKSLKTARPRRALYPAFASYPTRLYSSKNSNSNQRFEYSPPKQQATSSRHGPNAQRPSDFLTNATESSAVRGSTSTSAVGGIQEELQALDAQIKQLDAQQEASKQETLSRIPRYPTSEDDSQTSAPFDGTTTPQSAPSSAVDPADAHSQDQAPTRPLPDLMQGIPSTIDAELASSSQHGKSQPQDLNITEDPDAAGRGGRESHIKTEYISSIDRRRANYLRILYGFLILNFLGSAVYYGRNWADEEEERKHSDAPSGWGLRLFYNRMRARWQDTMDYYNEPAFPKLLPNMDATIEKPYTLILSLDDLLVHSEWTREHGWRMAKRPGVDYFLRYLCQYYELVIWTSSPSMYAQPIVAKLDPYRIVMWPLFREATRYQKGEYIKDLDYLNRNPKKVIMVDTVASHAKHQPENAIIIPKWKGNLDDKGLVSLIPFLEYCGAMNFDDLRTVLKSFEGKDIPTEFARRESVARSKLQKQLGEEQVKKPKRSKGMFSSFTGGAPKMIGPDGTEMPSYADSADEAKTYADFIRERGQKQYELLEREIRANGESWLKEMAEEEKKMNDEAMQGLKTSAVSYIPFFGGKSSADQGCVIHSLDPLRISVPSQSRPTEEIHWSVFDRHTQATASALICLRRMSRPPQKSPVSGFVTRLAAAAAAAAVAIHSSVYEHGRPAHRSSMMKRKQLPGEGVAPPAASTQAKQVDGVQEGEAGRSAVTGRIPRKPLSSSHSKEGVVSHGALPTPTTFPTPVSGPERSPSPLDAVDDPDTSFASAESQPGAPDSAAIIRASSPADEDVATGAAEAGRSRPSISTLGDEDTSALETGYSTDSVSDASEDPAPNDPVVVAPASPNMSKGKGKEPQLSKPSCTTLPAEILETILYLVDPETFSSLVLVDSAWRKASQTPHLYAYHLSRCPSYALNNAVADAGPFTDDSLLQLKRKFAREVKKNLFEAYLQPRRTIVNIVSTTTSSSAAFPRGEAFEFVFSPNGHWTLALSSSRIYVLDTASPKISVQRELKVLRRPTCAAILDTGTTLAVPSKDHHINIYDLSNFTTKHIRSVTLDNKPHAIAMTPKGEVLATAFDGGVELHALTSNAGEMDRRTIKCDRIDSLTFSTDGTMLLGTTRNARNPNTVVLTAPYYTDENQDLPASEQISRIWTSQIIFPTSSRDCSHAALLSSRSDGDASWTFTFDRVFESFRAVRTDDLRNGTTYFTGPKRPRRNSSSRPKRKLTPCTLPAASDCGDLVAAGFLGKDVWIYSVPDGLDVPVLSHADDPTSNSSTSSPSGNARSPARSFTRGEAAELMRLPQWQVLVDKYRNVFAKGRRVLEVSGPTSLSWVSQARTNGSQSLKERLVVAAPGGITSGSGHEEEGFGTVDGGRLLVLDFDRSPKDGTIEELTFEVGDAVPELLEEERVDIDTEVALARRRTRKEPRPMSTVVDALASTSDNVPPLPPTANAVANLNAANREVNSTNQPSHPSPPASPPNSDSPGLTMEEASEAFDGPYSHTQPRSRTSLYRSATAVLANRQRNPPRIADGEPVRYRRADGRGELPHESDADNWVPPPPPYAPKADVPLPEHLRKSIMPRPTDSLPFPRQRGNQEQMRRSSTTLEGRRLSSLPERPSRNPQSQTAQAPMTGRSVSESLEQLTGSISPVSSRGFDFGDGNERSTPISRSSTASSRRPVSAFVGRISHSLRRSSNPRLRSADLATDDVPPVPPVPSQTTSLPPSPTQDQRPVSPITLTGTNLQRRLEYPLPPAPANTSTPTNTSQHDLTEVSMPALPTTAQLSHLNDRYNTPPPKPSTTRLPPGLTTSGDRIPAPPRGAMGAAGGTNSPRHNNSRAASPINPTTTASATGDHSNGSSLTPTRNLSGRNSLAARSSPALLRPQAQRLDTIESISSIVSARTKTRSRTRSGGRELRSAGSGMERTQSSGPALRLDRITTTAAAREGKKGGFFGRGKRKEGKGKGTDAGVDAWNGAHPGEGDGGERGAYAEDRARRMELNDVDGKGEKGGKCVIM